jgi:putative heme iron utilization protein
MSAPDPETHLAFLCPAPPVHKHTLSGGIITNDCAQTALVDSIPFGGVGASGRASFFADVAPPVFALTTSARSHRRLVPRQVGL